MSTPNPTGGGSTSLVKVLAAAESGERYPVMNLIRKNPEQAAVIAKLVSALIPPRHDDKGNRELPTPNVMELRAMGNRLSRDITDAESVLSMLPDMELSMQILVSAILSPKDMVTIDLNYLAAEGVLPVELSSALLNIIRTLFDQGYKIKPELTKILRDMLFEKGSHVRAVIPESSLDEIINRHAAVTMESVADIIRPDGSVRGVGFLGSGLDKKSEWDETKRHGVALEDFGNYEFNNDHDAQVKFFHGKFDKLETTLESLPGVFVTDNPAILSYPRLQAKMRKDKLRMALRRSNKLNVTMEAFSSVKMQKLTDRELTAALFKRPSNAHKVVDRLVTNEQSIRRSVGEPLVMELPPESVIPVTVPGQPEKHVGYFLILDNTGNPVRGKSNHDYYSELSQRLDGTGGGSMPSQLLQRVKGMTTGFDCSNNEHLDYSVRVYGDMIEQDLLARLRNGVYTNGVALARNQEIFRVMLARTLSKQQTQLLFLPVELVTYFAFDYNADGIGKSLLSNMKVLNSLRATLMFANVMQSVRNSIGLTNVNLKLDEEDPDPQKTVERMMSEVVRGRQQAFPLNTSSPADIVYQLQRAGYQFTWEGHPGLPDVKVEMTERNTNYALPDPALEENLRKRAIMATGLNPETVDTAFNGEFATSVLNNNLLLSRRVMQRQDEFMPQLKDHLGKYILASQATIDEMREQIAGHWEHMNHDPDLLEQIPGEGEVKKANAIDFVLHEFIAGMTIELPRPNTVTTQNQLTALQGYIELLDIGLDGWFNQKFMSDTMTGQLSATAEALRELIRAHYIRKWMADNGVLPELADMTARDEDGKLRLDFSENNKAFLESIMGMSGTLLAAVAPIKKKLDEDLKKLGIQGDAGGFGGGGGGAFGAPGGGGDDFGAGGGDTTPDVGGLPGEDAGTGEPPAGGTAGAGEGTAAPDTDSNPPA